MRFHPTKFLIPIVGLVLQLNLNAQEAPTTGAIPSSINGQGTVPTIQSNIMTDPNYKLVIQDKITISVYREEDLSLSQAIDAKGEIRDPLLGILKLTDLTVREAEIFYQEEFVRQRILRNPTVTINVLQYALKTISITGAVGSPGQTSLRPGEERIEILELISRVGGLRIDAKGKDVRITRTHDNGTQSVFRVDVESRIKQKRAPDGVVESFWVYPGDQLFIDIKII